MPPLVQKIREAVARWRESGYKGASDTSTALLRFWFETPHPKNFRFYFSQREAIESVIYLYEVANARDRHDLLKFDSSHELTFDRFAEYWTRYVVKMATGAGKTKVAALVIVWSYFHKLYEQDSTLSKNFLVIAPNIIVLNRLLKDFEGLRMFLDEPFLPDDGFAERDWRADFQPTLHIQDEVKSITDTGNIFLTNIHRVFVNTDPQLTIESTFLGLKPKPDADTSKGIDLGKILRGNQIEDLVVINDEAHHVHDTDLTWYQCIEDIHNKLKLRQNNGLSLQVDFSATPKHTNGSIFVQTICDYPLVEAIRQNVVKSPVLPDEASRLKLEEKDSDKFTERYSDYIRLGYIEWEKQCQNMSGGKKPVLFIMTMNTKEADETAEFLEREYPAMRNSVLTIHTNNKGEIKDNSKKDKEELQRLRDAADAIDKGTSQYKAVVSVLMLREGWDVRSVCTIVGLRPFKADSKILPEQAIGRGLRKMFDLETPEQLVVIGTDHFLKFIEDLKTEGVEFEYTPMGEGTAGKSPVTVSVDKRKAGEELDIPIPKMEARLRHEYKNLDLIDVSGLEFAPVIYKQFSPDELKEIVFRDIDGKITHTTIFTDNIPDYRNVLGFITGKLMRQCGLVSGFNTLYPKVESFVKYRLFGREISLSDPQTSRNLSEPLALKTIDDTFGKAIANLTITDSGQSKVSGFARVAKAKPVTVKNQSYIAAPKKSLFDKVIGDSALELEFAAEMERWPDVMAYAKNTPNGVAFSIEYQDKNGHIRAYYTDFLVKTSPTTFFAVELKGVEDDDAKLKRDRLKTWCEDVNSTLDGITWQSVYILQSEWERYKGKIRSFKDVIDLFIVK